MVWPAKTDGFSACKSNRRKICLFSQARCGVVSFYVVSYKAALQSMPMYLVCTYQLISEDSNDKDNVCTTDNEI